MKGNFISSNTWNSTRVNNTEISLPNIDKKSYNLLNSTSNNLSISKEKFLFSSEVVENIKNFVNLELEYNVKENNPINEVVNLELNKDNNQLIDIIKINVEENAKLNLNFDYFSNEEIEGFRHSVIEINAGENSDINIVFSQRLSLGIMSIQSVYLNANKNSKVKIIQVDLGASENYVSYRNELVGENAQVDVKSIYFGKKNQKLDYNYNTDQIGQYTNYDLFVRGALADKCRKNCKLSIDFKRGSSNSKGIEEEYVTLLSDEMKNVVVPILLCTEDNVEGVHAASAGKIDENMLFYIMSRGFDESDAKRLILEAQYAQTIDLIENEELRNKVYETLANKLSEV